MASQTTDWRLGDVTSLQPHAVVGAWVAKSQAREFHCLPNCKPWLLLRWRSSGGKRWLSWRASALHLVALEASSRGESNKGVVMDLAPLTALLLQVFRKPLPAICKLPMEKGECRASLLRWHYNIKSGRCERFSYGGCGGNENNFLSRNQCRIACRRP